MKADYCLKSSAVFTGIEEKTKEACILIKKNRIIDVVPFEMKDKFIDENTIVLDYKNKLIMPGFVDAHTHFFSGALSASEHVCDDIVNSVSEEECVKMLLQYAKAHPKEKRSRGRGWFITNWGDAPLPTKKSLDKAFPDIPVYLQAADCHSYWCNSKALEECRITKDMEVSSGYIGKLENGELSGMLVELEALQPADKMYRSFTKEEQKDIYINFIKKTAANGITSLSEMMPADYNEENYVRYTIIKELEKEKNLNIRLHIFPKLYDCENYDMALKLQKEFDSDYMRISGVKGFIDGVTETYTGLLLEPYTDNPDTRGIGVPVKSQRELNRSVIKANAAGLPVRIHCIADGSVRMALDAFEESAKVNKNNLANTIEHIENIDPVDIHRFKELKVIPSMQPIHLILDAHGKINRIGKKRIQYEWPVKTLLDDCHEMAFGTDYPVVEINPFENIYAAVTRKNKDGSPASYNPWEKVSMAEALKAYTYGAAKAYSRENELGSLEKGKLADVIVIDRNLFEVSEKEILEAKVDMTMLGGKIIYEH